MCLFSQKNFTGGDGGYLQESLRVSVENKTFETLRIQSPAH